MTTQIMVFNDAQEVLDLFRELLTNEGYQVTLYSYGQNDIQRVEESQPELLILDYLPGEEKVGWQLLQKLKMKRSTENIPIIICTTQWKLAQDIEGYMLSKGILVVYKPFNIDDLLIAVKKAIPLTNAIGDGRSVSTAAVGD